MEKIREREFSTVVFRDDQHNKAMVLPDDAKTLSDANFNNRASSKLIFCADIHSYQQKKSATTRINTIQQLRSCRYIV